MIGKHAYRDQKFNIVQVGTNVPTKVCILNILEKLNLIPFGSSIVNHSSLTFGSNSERNPQDTSVSPEVFF